MISRLINGCLVVFTLGALAFLIFLGYGLFPKDPVQSPNITQVTSAEVEVQPEYILMVVGGVDVLAMPEEIPLIARTGEKIFVGDYGWTGATRITVPGAPCASDRDGDIAVGHWKWEGTKLYMLAGEDGGHRCNQEVEIRAYSYDPDGNKKVRYVHQPVRIIINP